MLLTLVKLSPVKVAAELSDDSTGEAIAVPRQLNRYSEDDIKWLMSMNPEFNLTGINAELAEICGQDNGDKNRRGYNCPDPPESVRRYLIESNPDAAPPFECTLRDITTSKKDGQTFINFDPQAAFLEALTVGESGFREPVIEWTDSKAFSCLDIDYHDTPIEQRPTYAELSDIVAKVRPLPYCWHRTHGNGAKLYYSSKPGYTADELASVAGLLWHTIDPRCTFDPIKSTRHPCYARSRDGATAPCDGLSGVAFLHGAGDVSALKRLLKGELDENDTDEFLQSRSWNRGQVLPHSDCPIRPDDDAKQCVYVGDGGVFCHKCYAKGYGGSSPGFVGFSVLAGKQFDSRLYRMVRHFCHLEHARIVLSNIYSTVAVKVLETVYRVLLKIMHGFDDPRIGIAMTAGRGFIRTKGQWVSADGEHVIQKGTDTFVKSLPATLIPKGGEKGGFTTNVSISTSFQNSCDLEEYGYPDISLLKGCKIYGVHQKYQNDEIVKVITKHEFRKSPPQYLIRSKRMQSDDAWGLLEAEFPGIDRNYVKLLIAAKGSSEGRLSQCPYLLVAGPSGSGKSTTVQIAAGLCGDRASEPIFVPQVDRFRQSIMDAARVSGFLCINEVFKLASRAKLSHTQALDPMLSLTEDSRSHVLYVGSVPFGRLPVFVLTDINIPIEVEQDIQLSRRFTYYRLQQRNFWSDTFVKKRIQPHEFRLISVDHNAAADAIISEVIDEWFHVPMGLDEIAKTLGIQTLQSYSDDVDNRPDRLRAFFTAVCEANPLIGGDALRYKGTGWKKVDRVTVSTLRDSWDEFADDNGEHWTQSRVLQAEDWATLLKMPFPVVCELRPYRNSIVYVRFRSTDSPKYPAWVNGKEVSRE